MCMYIISKYMYGYIYVYLYLYIYISTLPLYIYIHMYTSIYVFTYLYIYIYRIFMFAHVNPGFKAPSTEPAVVLLYWSWASLALAAISRPARKPACMVAVTWAGARLCSFFRRFLAKTHCLDDMEISDVAIRVQT